MIRNSAMSSLSGKDIFKKMLRHVTNFQKNFDFSGYMLQLIILLLFTLIFWLKNVVL